MNILVVEDERNLADALVRILNENHWNAEAVGNGIDGLAYAESGAYSAVVLDVMLPGMDGHEVCRRMRADGVSTPVLMLTARSETKDKVAGLDSGADDYLTKPFDPTELLARLRALTRRTGEVVLDALSFADLTLNLVDMTLSCENGKSVHLSQREGAVLELLMRPPQPVLSKSALLARVWGSGGDAGANNVEAYISFLRKKIHHLHSTVQIATLRMLGYRLEIIDA